MKKLRIAVLLGTTALVPAALAQQPSPRPDASPAPQAQQEQQAQPGQAAQQPAQTLRAEQIRNRPLLDAQGREIGQAIAVVRGEGEQTFVVARTSQVLGEPREVVIPIQQIALAEDRLIVQQNEQQLQQLQVFEAQRYQEFEGEFQLQAGGQPQQDQAATITVRQQAPEIQVQQAQPQVRVQQAQPQVTVRQANPQIIVRQAPPTITIQQPQPEIIVRMPEPQVDVAQAQPQVEVHMPQPQVRVEQAEQQAAVAVQPGQAQVEVVQAEQQAAVAVQQGQPQVSFERTGEPNVVFQQAEGQPAIRYERLDPQQQGQAGVPQQGAQQQQTPQAPAQPPAAQAQQQATQPQPPAGQQPQQPAEQRAATTAAAPADQFAVARQRLGIGQQEAAVPADVPRQPIAVSDIEGRNVQNFQGEDLGKVDRVIVDAQTQQHYVVLAHGGFLGIGQSNVVLPLERFFMQGDRLLVSGVTEQDLEALDDYDARYRQYPRVGAADQVNVGRR